ncbi:hypothetical protein [Spiroplasma endosymbiont of Agriotes lineatus]|uniref:hypothetical protein n=1 Tax=Spiroplasma endosymbiont of Agriotes lineatus TaxID=3077930 RepID=UPI0030D57836
MFMKIFAVLIIGFNNIFIIPQNIKNDKITTQSLIRNKRESKETYELNLKKGFVYLVKNRWKKTYYWYKTGFIYTYTTMTNKYAKLNKN